MVGCLILHCWKPATRTTREAASCSRRLFHPQKHWVALRRLIAKRPSVHSGRGQSLCCVVRDGLENLGDRCFSNRSAMSGLAEMRGPHSIS